MNAHKLPPLPKFFQGFETEAEAGAHCAQHGAWPYVFKAADGLAYPGSFPTKEGALAFIAAKGIAHAFPMGLRVDGNECYAIGIDRSQKAAQAIPAPAAQEGDETPASAVRPPVARQTGATFVCKALAAEHPEFLATKELFIAEAGKLGVIAATAGTQWYRLRPKG